MPYEVKIGSRWGGLARNLLEVTEQRRKRQEEQEYEFRKFNRDLQKLLLQRDDLSDEATQAILSGKSVTGVPLRRTSPFDPAASGLVPSSYTDPSTGIGYKSPQDTRRSEFLDTSRIRQEFLNRPEVKEYVTINTNVRTMDTILREAQRTGQVNKVSLDQALITMYNKLTDPNSVVRESEYARTPENLPLVNRLSGAIQKVTKGGAGLTDADRDALVWGAKVIANERGRTFNTALSDYTDLSQRYGMEQELVTRGLQPHQAYTFAGSPTQGSRPGGVLMEDANGNRAIVYPDGTFEELP